jgi:hypothetical protein
VNELDPRVAEGTFGELLVILRLLEHHVQASFTLKDSGNDLLAASPTTIKSIQVKSTTSDRWQKLPGARKKYHVLALVKLVGRSSHLDLDKCKIYLLTKDEVGGRSSIAEAELEDFALERRIDPLFAS